MNKNQFKGQIKQAKGRTREITGKVIGDRVMEDKGKVQNTAGKIQENIGNLEEDLKKGS